VKPKHNLEGSALYFLATDQSVSVNSWKSHPIRTANHKSPQQLFTAGVLVLQQSGLTAMDFFLKTVKQSVKLVNCKKLSNDLGTLTNHPFLYKIFPF